MSFSWIGGSQASQVAYDAEVAQARDKTNKQQAERAPIDDRQRGDAQKIGDLNIDLANKKALDVANRKTANYKAGTIDPEEQATEDTKKLSDLNTALTNKKALDIANKKTSDYAAGIADPEEARAKANKEKADIEAGMSDYEQYDRKQSLDIKNQDAAWANASKYKQSDAAQSNVAQKDRLVAGLDNQKAMQQTTINQANKLRSDDNQRAINGFKMNF